MFVWKNIRTRVYIIHTMKRVEVFPLLKSVLARCDELLKFYGQQNLLLPFKEVFHKTSKIGVLFSGRMLYFMNAGTLSTSNTYRTKTLDFIRKFCHVSYYLFVNEPHIVFCNFDALKCICTSEMVL